jgi:hypothetical protein
MIISGYYPLYLFCGDIAVPKTFPDNPVEINHVDIIPAWTLTRKLALPAIGNLFSRSSPLGSTLPEGWLWAAMTAACPVLQRVGVDLAGVDDGIAK